MSLEERFEKAVKQVKSMPSGSNGPNNNEKLTMYGLYKQATVGDNTTDMPGFLNITGRAKWGAWNEYKGLSKEDAMTKYCEELDKLTKKYS